MRPLIDWEIISEAMSFYKAEGYHQVEVPWIVPIEAICVTHQGPIWVFDKDCPDNGSTLVGSAEQGFIHIAKTLPPGKYVSCSPCFRYEDEDDLHQRSFMKVELYQTDEVSDEALENMVKLAVKFLAPKIYGYVISTTEGFDIITAEDIELGSYGRRTHNSVTWLYGTGVALPRLSISLED